MMIDSWLKLHWFSWVEMCLLEESWFGTSQEPHKVRFMAFGIYVNLMYSFFDQHSSNKEVEAALQRFVQFLP